MSEPTSPGEPFGSSHPEETQITGFDDGRALPSRQYGAGSLPDGPVGGPDGGWTRLGPRTEVWGPVPPQARLTVNEYDAWSPPPGGEANGVPPTARDAGPHPGSSGGGGRRPRHRFAWIAASALLFVTGAFAGVTITRHLWPTHTSTTSQVTPIGGSSSSGAGGSSSSAGGSGLGSSGSVPSGDSGSLPYGGSGSDGSGSLPYGGSGSGGSSSSGSDGPSNVTSIAAAVAPALVDINVTNGNQGSQGAATGIVLTDSGLVLTNNHVIDGATSISATDVGNGQTYSATVVGYDVSHDIAVIQLSGASGLTTAKFGDSSSVTVGQQVVAIGNAGGSGGTPSAAGGSITALDQQITAGDESNGTSEQLSGLLATDADIQAGDSGGPLVTTSGEVIGVDTAGSSGYSYGYGGTQGFAVPANTAMTIVSQIEHGQASATVHIGETAFLGVELDSSAGSSGGYGYGGGYGDQSGASGSGATLAGVLSGSPAEQIGLTGGDVIVAVDGQTVDSPATLSSLLSTHKPGDKVQIDWVDQSGTQQTGTAQLAAGPAA